MTRPSVVVVGAGVAGLAAAWELSGGAHPHPDAPRVEVIEAGPVVGGALGTVEFAGRVIDAGPDSYLAVRPEFSALVEELGLTDQIVGVSASGASIYLRGAVHPLPPGLALGVPTNHQAVDALDGMSWRARLAARRDEVAPRRLSVGEDETIGRIVRAKLGDEIAYQLVEPMMGGIQAGRIDQLSARSVAPVLLEAARRGGSLMRALAPPANATPTRAPGPAFATLRDGVGSLPRRLGDALIERGVVVRTGTAVNALRESRHGARRYEVDTEDTTTAADAVILATPGPVTGHLAGHLDPALDALREITSASVAMITLATAREDFHPNASGTGVLIPLGTPGPDGESMLVTAITFLERKWPHQAVGDAIVRAHVGRSDDTRFAALDDETLVARVARELRVILGGPDEVRGAYVRRFADALPQYEVGHADLVARAQAAAGPRRLALAGNAYDGVGIPASIGSGRRAAREVLALLA